jgi:hypothetical protein
LATGKVADMTRAIADLRKELKTGLTMERRNAPAAKIAMLGLDKA